MTDFQLVAQQLNGGDEAPNERMVRCVKISRDLMANFDSFKIVQVPRKDKNHADVLTNLGLTSGMVLKRVVPFAYQDEQSNKALKLTDVISVTPSED